MQWLKRKIGQLIFPDNAEKMAPFFVEVGGQRYYAPFMEPQQPVFVLSTGRSGTHFIARLMEQDLRISSSHTDTIKTHVGDSFLRYCLWNELPVDTEGFLSYRQDLINCATSVGAVYFEANSYLSLSVSQLFDRFQAKFIYLTRRPADVINSHFVKGWYSQTPILGDLDLSLGYQYQASGVNHFFGRIVPRGKEFIRWRDLTQIGKISWMWNTLNLASLNQLEQLPKVNFEMIKLDKLNYSAYLRLHSFVGGFSPLVEQEFNAIRQARPGKGSSKRTTDCWSNREMQEFLSETKQARHLLGYD